MDKRNIQTIYPLSPAQEGMLYATLADDQGTLFFEQNVCELRGDVNFSVLAKAWQLVTNQHEILRTGFVFKGKTKPLQYVLRNIEASIEYFNIGANPADLSLLKEQDKQKRFRLDKAPLIRVSLVETGYHTFELIISMHHILMDGWSNVLMLHELLDVYSKLSSGDSPRFKPVRPYKDYVSWLLTKDTAATEKFWTSTLEDFGEASIPGKLVAGLAEENDLSEEYARKEKIVGGKLVVQMNACIQNLGLTWNTILQACTSLLMAHCSSSDKVIFGSTLADRPNELAGVDATLGLFINTLPVTVDLSCNILFLDWLVSIQKKYLDVQEHSYCGGGQVHRWSSMKSNQPLFNLILVYENYLGNSNESTEIVEKNSIELINLKGDGGRTQAPITLLIANDKNSLHLKIVYKKQNFSLKDADLFLNYFAQTLDVLLDALSNPGEALFEIQRKLNFVDVPEFKKIESITKEFSAAETVTERQLADIWKQVLRLDEVCVNSTFFELGGHSLVAIKLLANINEMFSSDLSMVILFKNPTIRALGKILAEFPANNNLAVTAISYNYIEPSPESRFKPFPMTDIQQAYWVGRTGLFEGGNISTHSYMEFNAAGIHEEKFHKAINQLIVRHDMLRMIVEENGFQRILESVPEYITEVEDLRELEDCEKKQRLLAIRDNLSHEVLSIGEWPLFKFKACRLSETQYRLHVSIDMLIVDGSSHHILIKDFLMLYGGYEKDLSELKLTFRDYVMAMEQLKLSHGYAKAKDYWIARLDSFPPAPDLPLASTLTSEEKPTFSRRKSTLEKSKWSKLKKYCHQFQVTESVLLCSIYSEALRIWSKNLNFSLNLTLFTRHPIHPDVNNIVGDFTSTLLLQVSSSGPTFIERVKNLQNQLWTDLENSLFSGVEFLRALNRQNRRTTIMPIVFTSGLVFNDSVVDAAEQQNQTDQKSEEENFSIGQTSQVWLDFQVLEIDGELHFYLDSVDSIFREGVTQNIFNAIEQAINKLCDETGVDSEANDKLWHHNSLNLFPEQQMQLINETNNTNLVLADLLLHEPISQFRSSTAVAIATAELTISYCQLNQWLDDLSGYLATFNLAHNTAIAVLLPKSWEQVLAVLAIHNVGHAYVPLDASAPTERIQQILNQANIKVVITIDSLATKFGLENFQAILLDTDFLQKISGCYRAPDKRLAMKKSEDTAYIIFTSGSTGTPKGVVIDHKGAVNTVISINKIFNVQATDAILALSALNFDLSVYDIFGMINVGGKIVVPCDDKIRDPQHWFQLIESQQITILNAVPALINLFIDYIEQSQLKVPDCVRLIMMSGDWIPIALPDRIRAVSHSTIDIYSLGGATEASIWSIVYPITKINPDWKSIPYGKALPNQTYHVLKADFSVCPIYTTGDLYIGGVGLAKYYLNDIDKTQKSFVCCPQTGERLYRTGDMGRYLADGNIEFLGREDFQVKIQGYRIELGEIEFHLENYLRNSNCLSDFISATTALQAIAIVFGEKEDGILVVYVTTGNELDKIPYRLNMELEKSINNALQKNLPDYMLPRAYMMIDNFPLTLNGKIDRQKLPAPLLNDNTATVNDRSISSKVEVRIADMWEELLGSRPHNLTDNFFDLGGNSVTLVQISTRLRNETGAKIDLAELFMNPTIEFMCNLIISEDSTFAAIEVDQLFLDIAKEQAALHWLKQLTIQDIELLLIDNQNSQEKSKALENVL